MTSVTLTSPPIATARLVVDKDIVSFVFKWHPNSPALRCHSARFRVGRIIHDVGRDAPRRSGRELGAAQVRRTGAYLAGFSVLHSDSLLCSTWAAIRNESTRKGLSNGFRRVDCRCGAGSVGTAGDEQSEGLPPPGQAPACFHRGRISLQIEKLAPPADYSSKVAKCLPKF